MARRPRFLHLCSKRMPTAKPSQLPSGTPTEVPRIQVGQSTHDRRTTGCTVVLSEEDAAAVVDVCGGSRGTREADLVRREMPVK